MSAVVTPHDGALACDCKRCVRADPARFAGNRVGDLVARAGLASARKHGIANLRYGCYRHDGERRYQWGNFTGSGATVHVVRAIEPDDENTASTESLIAALRAAGGE